MEKILNHAIKKATRPNPEMQARIHQFKLDAMRAHLIFLQSQPCPPTGFF